jgi:hypothetical protein
MEPFTNPSTSYVRAKRARHTTSLTAELSNGWSLVTEAHTTRPELISMTTSALTRSDTLKVLAPAGYFGRSKEMAFFVTSPRLILALGLELKFRSGHPKPWLLFISIFVFPQVVGVLLYFRLARFPRRLAYTLGILGKHRLATEIKDVDPALADIVQERFRSAGFDEQTFRFMNRNHPPKFDLGSVDNEPLC